MRYVTRRRFLGLMGAGALTSCARLDPRKTLGLQGPPGPMTFATIGDLHVTDIASAAIVNRAIASINANPDVRFTVAMGDFAANGQLSELRLAKASLDRLERPYYVIPGNHDADPAAADSFRNFNTVFEWEPWTESVEGWLLMGVNTCDADAVEVAIQPDQMDWIRARLERVGPDRPIALFVHHPLNPNSARFRVTNADAVLDLFADHNLRLAAGAHYHGNQVETRNGVLFTTTACCSTTVDNLDGTDARGYRLFRIDDTELTTEFVEVPV